MTKTSDAKKFVKRKMSQILEGRIIEFPRKLFRKLAGVEEDYFKQGVDGIKRKELSVGDSIANYYVLSAHNTHEELARSAKPEQPETFPPMLVVSPPPARLALPVLSGAS